MLGTRNVLEACKKQGVSALALFASHHGTQKISIFGCKSSVHLTVQQEYGRLCSRPHPPHASLARTMSMARLRRDTQWGLTCGYVSLGWQDASMCLVSGPDAFRMRAHVF